MSVPGAVRTDPVCQTTLDHLVALVRVWTPEDGVVYVNRTWRELTGTTLEDNLGDGWLRYVHADDRAAVLVALGSVTGGAKATYRLQGHDGQAVAVSDCPTPWTDEASQQVIGVVHTVTTRDGEDRSEHTRAMSTWAHELRGPLNAILGWSDLLGNGENNIDVMQRGLKAIANNARQQAQIIKRMTE